MDIEACSDYTMNVDLESIPKVQFNENDPVLKWFSLLKEIAMSHGKVARARIASAILYKKRIVGVGTNSYKTSPLQMRFSKNSHSIYLHGEIYAIKNALRNIDVSDLKRSKILVCRMKYFPEKHRYEFGLARPCVGCMRAIETFEIPEIIYTGEWRDIYIERRR